MKHRFLLSSMLFVLSLSLSNTLAQTNNLLLNSSFEYETSESFSSGIYWSMHHPDTHGDAYGSAWRESWRAEDGEFSMAIRGTWAGADDYGGFWREVPALPDNQYQFSAWTWADKTWAAHVCEIKLEFWNHTHSLLISSHSHPLQDIVESWQNITLQDRTPPGAAWIRVVFHASGIGPEGSILFDSLSLCKKE
jgi:hypothetical protein